MSVLNAIVLGIIQGVTYFLPVSSSGHISAICNLFGLTTTENEHMFFDVLLHLGTVFSVLIVYWPELTEIFYDVRALSGYQPDSDVRSHSSARFFLLIVVASIPLLLILPIYDYINMLFGKNIFIGVMIVLTGCMLFVSEKFIPGKKTERSMSMLDAIIVGICQCISTIPGLSQPGITITAGLATGLKREFAVKFSFILAVPAILGANILTLVHAAKTGIEWHSVPAYLVGTVFSMISGIITLSFIKKNAKNIKLSGFAYYCWIAGVLVIILTMIF